MKKSKAMESVKVFLWKHRWGIAFAGTVVGMGFLIDSFNKSQEQKAIETAINKAAENADFQAKMEENRKAFLADPSNHLGNCGIVEDDFWNEEGFEGKDMYNMIISGVSLKDLGQFGQEIAKRSENSGVEEIQKAVNMNSECDIVITMYQPDKPPVIDEEEPAAEAMDEEPEVTEPTESTEEPKEAMDDGNVIQM